jgi:hypothetical protein
MTGRRNSKKGSKVQGSAFRVGNICNGISSLCLFEKVMSAED